MAHNNHQSGSTSTLGQDIQHAKAHGASHHETIIDNVLQPTPSHFEKLYLEPQHPQVAQPNAKWTFGNPTPIAIAGFVLANTHATIDLMGWGGAGGGTGNASAGIGSFYFCGAVLLYFGGLGEWIIGNTFPAVIFFTFGGFWATFGATLTPFYNAVAAYEDPSGFYNSFAYFLFFFGLLCFFYMIAALRTNLCLVLILACFVVTFPCLTASYFCAARGMAHYAETTRIAGAAFAFIASMIAWYLWFSMILESVDFPYSLPVGDLSKYIKGKSEKLKSEREMA